MFKLLYLNFTDLTVSYSENSKGWTSFFSYIPEQMVGMNNFFYSFKGGNIYQHNTNALRNNYYGVQYMSQIKSVFNEVPLENKVFKTLNIEGENAWTATLETDLPEKKAANIDPIMSSIRSLRFRERSKSKRI